MWRAAQEFGGKDGSFKAKPGTAAAVTKAATSRNMLLLSAGARPAHAHARPSRRAACAEAAALQARTRACASCPRST